MRPWWAPGRATRLRLCFEPAVLVALGILAVGLFLRLYDLAGWPPEQTYEEVELYNSARSIVLTGHDLDGSLKVFLWAPFDRHPPLYAFAEYGMSLLLGNGPFALRLPAVLFGIVAAAALGAIAFELTERRRVALVTAALAATQPIFVHFSRIGWEPSCELPFLLGGLAFELRALRRLGRRRRADRAFVIEIAAAAILLGVTSYTYKAGWFYAVVLGAALAALGARDWWRPARGYVFAAAGLALAVAAPALKMWFDPSSGHTAEIETFYGGITPANVATFAHNYVAHFAWSYLVDTGDPVAPLTWRYLVGSGAFFGFVVPLAAIGLACARRAVRPPWTAWWLLVWLAAYPLGGSLTNEGVPNATRTLAGAPVFCILAAIGAVALDDLVRFALLGELRAAATCVLRTFGAVAMAAAIANWAVPYYRSYADVFPNAWFSGTRLMFAIIRDRAPEIDRVCLGIKPQSFNGASYLRYALAGVAVTEIDDPADARCFLPGTLLATDYPTVRSGFTHELAILEYEGAPFAEIAVRPRR